MSPSMHTTCTENWYSALIKKRHQRKCMICGALLYPELGKTTAPVLSQFTTTVCPCQKRPYTAHAKTIGRSSIHVMLSTSSLEGSRRPFQHSCIHLSRDGHIAPHPNDPKASNHRTTEGDLGWGIILTPFQSVINVFHNKMSEQTAEPKWIWWCDRRAPARALNRRHMNVFPGCTTLLA